MSPPPPLAIPPPTMGGGVVLTKKHTKYQSAKAPKKNHPEERLLDQAQVWALYTPPFWGSFA